MPSSGIEPETRGFSVLCSTNWANWALSCGNRIWTYDLRVMSPASFQTAPPRAVILLYFFSCLFAILGREGFEPSKALPADLQSVPFGHSGICPFFQGKPDFIYHCLLKADERTRTVNLLITNQLLCQLSHIGLFIFLHLSAQLAEPSFPWLLSSYWQSQ